MHLADRYTAEYLADPRKCPLIDSAIAVAENLRNKPCTVGIDEAGRGPVLGPMVYCAFACCMDYSTTLRAVNVADSKTLSMRRREDIFRAMYELGESTFWCAQVISPSRISSAMLSRSKYNLNQLSHDSAATLLRRLIDAGVNIKTVHVDTVGDPNKYRERLAAQFRNIEFIVCPKADSLFAEVSAASICAKVLRDRCVECWPLSVTLTDALTGTEITEVKQGSGYPSDPDTQKFLLSVFEPVFGFPDFVRFSWSTAERLLLDNGVVVRWCDNSNLSAQKTTRKSLNVETGATSTAQQRKRLASPSEVGSLHKFLVPKESIKYFSNQLSHDSMFAYKQSGQIGDSNQADQIIQRRKRISKYRREPDCFTLLGLRFSHPNRNKSLPVSVPPPSVVPPASQLPPSFTPKTAPAATQSSETHSIDATAQSPCSSHQDTKVIGACLRSPYQPLCDETTPDCLKAPLSANSSFGLCQPAYLQSVAYDYRNTAVPSFSGNMVPKYWKTSFTDTFSQGQAPSPQWNTPFTKPISNYPETDFDVKYDISLIEKSSLDPAVNNATFTRQVSPMQQIKQEFYLAKPIKEEILDDENIEQR